MKVIVRLSKDQRVAQRKTTWPGPEQRHELRPRPARLGEKGWVCIGTRDALWLVGQSLVHRLKTSSHGVAMGAHWALSCWDRHRNPKQLDPQIPTNPNKFNDSPIQDIHTSISQLSPPPSTTALLRRWQLRVLHRRRGEVAQKPLSTDLGKMRKASL